MSFQEFINSIIGNEIFTNISKLVMAIICVIMTILYQKVKTKLTTTTDHSDKTLSAISEQLSAIKSTNKLLEKENDRISKSADKMEQALYAMGDIISSCFLSSKAVSDSTKKNISKSVALLKDLGVDMPALEVMEYENKKKLEEIEMLKEQAKAKTESEISLAEDAMSKAVQIYDEIVSSKK